MADPMSERAVTSAAAAEETDSSAGAAGVVSGRRPFDVPFDTTDEAALVRALMARDGRAATEAWRHFQPMVSRFLLRFFGTAPGRQADRQDLCQEVFMRFF